MSWSIGYDTNWKRDIGHGVPATCDHPGCGERIDRGLSYVCGDEPYGGDKGCGLYFCERHQQGRYQRCIRCARYRKNKFTPTPDVAEWINHKLTDESWARWRAECPEQVAELRAQVEGKQCPGPSGVPAPREPFVVKHYVGTERPIIKGNGFDGLEVGQDRDEAQEFVDWINNALGVKGLGDGQ